MTYRLLRQNARFESWTAMYVEGVDLAAVNAGVPVTAVNEPVRVMLSAWGREPSDFLERPCVIMSDAMRGVLDRAGVDNIQYFKAQLAIDLSHRSLYGFWLANVIGRVSCADRLASRFEPSDDADLGQVLSFEIDPALTYGLSLFRLAEDSRMLVLSPRIQAALREAGLQGILFQDARDYDRGLPIGGMSVGREE